MIALRSALPASPSHLERDGFASARHFPLGRPLANLTLNPDRKQCWQLAVRHPSPTRM
jgi:hypothetical protein